VKLPPLLHVLIQAPFLQAMIQALLRNRFRRIDSTSSSALIGAVFALRQLQPVRKAGIPAKPGYSPR
jgi:hypothetical protein